MTTKCWKLDNLCGFSLERCVCFAGIFTMIISIVAITIAWVTVKDKGQGHDYNTNPVRAMNLIFSLYCLSISVYQIGISIVLMWKRSAFLCSIWYVSHISIVTLYCLMFIAKIFVSYNAKEYLVATLTVLTALIYEGIFIFFMIIVRHYLAIID